MQTLAQIKNSSGYKFAYYILKPYAVRYNSIHSYVPIQSYLDAIGPSHLKDFGDSLQKEIKSGYTDQKSIKKHLEEFNLRIPKYQELFEALESSRSIITRIKRGGVKAADVTAEASRGVTATVSDVKEGIATSVNVIKYFIPAALAGIGIILFFRIKKKIGL